MVIACGLNTSTAAQMTMHLWTHHWGRFHYRTLKRGVGLRQNRMQPGECCKRTLWEGWWWMFVLGLEASAITSLSSSGPFQAAERWFSTDHPAEPALGNHIKHTIYFCRYDNKFFILFSRNTFNKPASVLQHLNSCALNRLGVVHQRNTCTANYRCWTALDLFKRSEAQQAAPQLQKMEGVKHKRCPFTGEAARK